MSEFNQHIVNCENFNLEELEELSEYTFPELQDFLEGGIFEDVKLPIPETDPVPEKIIDFIFGNNADSCKPRHVYNIRHSLNELLNV